MKRVYFNSIIKQGSTYELEKKYYIHLVKVIRLKIGDEISLFNNISGEWRCERGHSGMHYQASAKPSGKIHRDGSFTNHRLTGMGEGSGK